jgi:hypothetical protein
MENRSGKRRRRSLVEGADGVAGRKLPSPDDSRKASAPASPRQLRRILALVSDSVVPFFDPLAKLKDAKSLSTDDLYLYCLQKIVWAV